MANMRNFLNSKEKWK